MLAERVAEEAALSAQLEIARDALSAAQETVPEQEGMQSRITETELLLPSYDELEAYRAARAAAQAELAKAQTTQENAVKEKNDLTTEITGLRTEQKDLADVSAEKEKLAAQL